MALAIVVASGLIYRAVLIHQRDTARQRVVELTGEAAALRASNQALGQMIDKQNAAVAELKARADAAVNAMDLREAAAQRDGAAAQMSAEQQARALMTASIPASPGCAGAIQWGNQRAAELAAW